MKREDLEKIKLTKEQIDKVINLYHEEVTPIKEESEKTKAAYEKQKTELLAKEDKLKTTEEALKNFEGVNVSELKEKISALNKELEEKDKNYKTELAERDFKSLLDSSIVEAKGKNKKAISALLDLDTLRESKNQKEDIQKALEELSKSEDSKMLFGEPEPSVVGNGSAIGAIGTSGNNDNSEIDAIRAAMGLAPVENEESKTTENK